MRGFDDEMDTRSVNTRDEDEYTEFKPVYSPLIGGSMSPTIAQQNMLATSALIVPPFIVPYPYGLPNPYWNNWNNWNYGPNWGYGPNWNNSPHCNNCNKGPNWKKGHRDTSMDYICNTQSCNIQNLPNASMNTLFTTPIICRKCSELFD